MGFGLDLIFGRTHCKLFSVEQEVLNLHKRKLLTWKGDFFVVVCFNFRFVCLSFRFRFRSVYIRSVVDIVLFLVNSLKLACCVWNCLIVLRSFSEKWQNLKGKEEHYYYSYVPYRFEY